MTPAAGSDPVYAALGAVNVSITNTDNDGAALTDNAFVQSNWQAGVASTETTCLAQNGTWTSGQCVAVSPDNQAGWQSYANKQAGIEVINSGADLRAQVVNKSMTLTNNADFGLAGNNRSYTTYDDFAPGSVSNAKINNGAISLKPQTPTQAWATTANSGWNQTLAQSAANADFADLDGDGDLDMMAAAGQWLFGYRNIGTDTSPSWEEVTTWGKTSAELAYANGHIVALGDLDGDGDTDLLLAHAGQAVKAYENQGSSTAPDFQRQSDWDMASGAAVTVNYKIALGQLDGDAGDKLDLLLGGNYSAGPVEAYEFDISQAPGSKWVRKASWDTPSGAGYWRGPKPSIGDYDEDGDPDVVVGWFSKSNLQLLTNTNSGLPSTPAWSEAWGGATGLSTNNTYPGLVDIDSDGDLDIMIGSAGSADLVVYENTTTQYFSSGSYTSAAIDVGSHDGFTVLNYSAVTPGATAIDVDMRAADSSDFLSNSTGWVSGLATGADISALGSRRYVQYRVNLSTPTSTLTPVLTDLSFSILTYPLVTNTVAAGNALILEIESRTHAWTRESAWDHTATYNADPALTESPDTNNNKPSPALADMDGDGDLDMIRGDDYSQSLGFYENDGSNNWSYRSDWAINCCSSGSTEPTLADLDNDGDQDIILYSSLWTDVVVYENLGTASAPQWEGSSPSAQKAAWAIVKGGGTGAGVDLADLDMDGDLDAMVGDNVDGDPANRMVLGFENVGSNTNPAWLAKEEWHLRRTSCSPCTWYAVAPALADIDGDGDYDMIVANNGIPYAYENIGTAQSPSWNRKAAWDISNTDPDTLLTFSRTHVELVDLDADADADVDMLVGGDSAKIFGYRNTGVTDYAASGSYESEVLDFGSHLGFTTVDYDVTIRTGTTLTVKLRSGNTVKPDGSWTAWTSYADGADISGFGTNRYVQYKVEMTANGAEDTSPSFYSIDFNYTGVELATALTSSAYDSTAATNLIKQLWWTEALVAGSDIQVQLRTAPDSAGAPGTWSDWLGPDGSSDSYWNSANTYSGGCSGTGSIVCTFIPPQLRNGLNNQWLQYKVSLVSSGDVQATLNDIAVFYNSASDGSAVITVSPTTLGTTEDNGVTPTASFDVTLTGSPSANVDMYFDSADTSEGTVSPAQLTFSAGDMGPKTVTVTAVDDVVRDGNIAYQVFTSATISSDASFDALTAPDVTVTNTDDDTSLGAVIVSPTSDLITTEAGGAATFDVVLATAPTDDVRISVSASDTSEGLVTPSTLLFTSVNWNVAQTVTVTGLDDNLFDQTVNYTVITGAVASDDPNYTGMAVDDVAVSNTDNDSAAVVITPDDAVNGLTVNENGGARTFGITLASQPTANVMFSLSSSDLSEGTVLPFTMLTFTPSDWNVPQYGTVFGVEDNIVDGDVDFDIVTSPFISFGDPNFNGVNPPDVTATNQDNDGVYNIRVWPTTIKTAEDGDYAIVNFELTSKPSADVIIDLSSTDAGEAYVQERIILRPDDITWRGTTVRIYGVDDDLVDTDQAFSIITAAASSADPNYDGVDPTDIAGTNLSTNYKAIASGQDSAYAGRSVAMGDINGDGYADVAFGAPGYDAAFSNGGRVAVRYGQGTDIDLVSDIEWAYEGTALDAAVGQAVAIADVNNDGYADVIVGAPGIGNGGAVYVFHGSASGPSATPDQSLTHATVGANFGHALAKAGKLNNDVYDDIIIGAYGIDQAFIYHGSASGIGASADATLNGTASSQFGIAVGSAGNVNGDGYDDVIIGADRYDNGQTDEGAAYVYHGSASGVVDSVDWSKEIDQDDAYFGFAVAGAGDVNNDGYADVIIGAPNFDNGQADEGRVYLYHGSASGLAASFAVVMEPNQAGALYGYAVASAGDVNNDSYGDVIVGAPSFDNVQADEGRATIYFGSASGLDSTPQIEVESDQIGANFGVAVAGGSGSIDNDNYDDVIIGADLFDDSQTDEGRAYVYRAPPQGAGVTVTPTTGLQTTEAGFGGTVAYSLVLDTPPSDDVVLESFSGDTSEGWISSNALLTFTPANWNIPQNVYVTGLDDSVDDGDVFYDMNILARSNDSRYDGIAVDTVTIMNVNDEYSVNVMASDTVAGETGPDAGTFTFSRTGDVSNSLIVDYTVSGSADNGVDYNNLSGTVTIPATQSSVDVVITPVDDPAVDGGEIVTLTLDAIGTYNLGSNSSASITIIDNDAAGVTVTSATGLQTTEAGASANFTVVLNTAPSADVTIGLSVDVATEGMVSPTSLVFTPANWNTPQTVTAIGVDDAIVDGDALFNVVTATAVSADPAYGGVINPIDVLITNIDDDVLANVTVSATVPSIAEDGSVNGEFTVNRSGDTTAALVVNYAISGSAGSGTDFHSLGSSVVIPAGSSSSTVPVVIKDDSDLEGDEQLILSLSSSANYVLDLPNEATVTIVDDDQPVLPKVNFALDQTVGEGANVNVSVYLDKAPDAYPINVPYTVSGDATNPADHNAASGTVVISSGLSSAIVFNVVDDGVTGEAPETVIFSFGSLTGVEAGAVTTHTVTLVEDNVAPKVSLETTQGVANVALVSNGDGNVTVTATIDDPNPTDTHSYDWSATNNNLVDINDGDPSTLVFDPSALLNGFYKVRLTVTDDGTPALDTEIDLLLEVVSALPILSAGVDSDNDGINDVDETYDLDGDGIVDYLDDANQESYELPLDVNSVNAVMRTEAGLSLRLGDTAFAAGADGALVSVADIAAYGGGEGNAGTASAADTVANNGDYYDFEISGLLEAGQSARIVIPYTDSLPAGAVYRKYDPDTGWSEFVIDANNAVHSAPGAPGDCPLPGDVTYVTGMTAGHYCVQITIEDGGANDQDGVANHVIEDPAQIAFVARAVEVVEAPEAEVVSAHDGSGSRRGGGAVSPWLLLILCLVWRGCSRRSRCR